MIQSLVCKLFLVSKNFNKIFCQ